MVKPNRTFTLPELRAYVREKKLNKPEIKLSMKKADLIAGLKKHGHWNHKADARIELKKGAKPPMTKKKKITKKPKEAPKPKETPTGQKNLQELLKLGDLSKKISAEVEKKALGGDKFDPLRTPVIPADKWVNVKIFNFKATGKGKIYQAYLYKNLKFLIIRDAKTKDFIGANRWIDDGYDFVRARRHLRWSNGDIAQVQREKGKYRIPGGFSGSTDWLGSSATSSYVTKYYKYKDDPEGYSQTDASPNDVVYRVNFKPSTSDLNLLEW